MDKNNIDESEYSVDFNISEKYIAFSSELLRISLLIIGGLGTLIINGTADIFSKPILIAICLILFVISSAAALAHRYCATDCLSWYISWLRAKKNNDLEKSENEKKGFYKLLRFSKLFLATCEITFAMGIIFFSIAVLNLFCSL